MIKMTAWMNRECGNVHFSIGEMMDEAREMYDWGDDTNLVTLDELYKPIWIEV